MSSNFIDKIKPKFVAGCSVFEVTGKNCGEPLKLIRMGKPVPKQARKWRFFNERVQALKNLLTFGNREIKKLLVYNGRFVC